MDLFSYGFSYLLCNHFTVTFWIIVSVEHIHGFDLLALPTPNFVRLNKNNRIINNKNIFKK